MRTILLTLLFAIPFEQVMVAKDEFTPAERQQISIETPGLFSRSNAFQVDFGTLSDAGYSFPLPVGKVEATDGGTDLEIVTSSGDAVKAMFDGTVRLSRSLAAYGNVIVVRHDNGLETVYGRNAQNLVKVGQKVKAGQTIAIVGGHGKRVCCLFSIMVNGAKINPETLIDTRSHRLRKQMVVFRKAGAHVSLAVSRKETVPEFSLDPSSVEDDPFLTSATFKLDLEQIGSTHWAYPLPGAHVISDYGGRRGHSGVDIKTRPNDEIVAAFDGIVTRSCRYAGYGNCIVIRHAYGFETLYGHQSKNLVRVGQQVKAGEVIGLTGRTGRATTEHLHFETLFKGRKFNPAILFNHAKRCLQSATLTLRRGGGISSKKKAG